MGKAFSAYSSSISKSCLYIFFFFFCFKISVKSEVEIIVAWHCTSDSTATFYDACVQLASLLFYPNFIINHFTLFLSSIINLSARKSKWYQLLIKARGTRSCIGVPCFNCQVASIPASLCQQ